MQSTSQSHYTSSSTAYFEHHKHRAIELELAYLPQFYTSIATRWAMAHGDDLLATVLQRKEHIDAVILAAGKFHYIEHKFDFYKPELEGRQGQKRNVLIETVMNVRLNSPGWSKTTRADYILFAFERPPDEECLEVYLVKWPALKAWFTEHETEYREYTNYNKPNPSTFRIVPIADIQRALPVGHYRIHRTGQVERITTTRRLDVLSHRQ